MKPYISIAEQISLLESRNIIITNYKFAHRVLEYENYYCVINGYKSPFITSTNPDVYKTGTLFNEIVALYTFDRRLREIIFPELLRTEHVIKTIEVQSKKHEAIAHYHNAYGFVPLWVLSKIMTFGKVNSFYGIMLNKEKEQVASKFGLTPKVLKSLIDYLARFRNKCAHGERLYASSRDAFKPRPIPELPSHKELSIPHNQKGYKYGTTDILALLLAMKPFLQNARFSHLVGKVDYALNQKLRRRINKESFDYVANTMGLIGDWKKIKDM